MANEDKALAEFLQAFDERKRKECGRAQIEIQAVDRKRRTLAPLRNFLQKFVELGLIVPDARVGTKSGVALNATIIFSFYESESSPSWAPGVSLYFDHPAEVEMSVTNEVDRAKHGIVVIRSVTSHKDRMMLHQKFETVEQAKEALAKFLGKNAVAIENDPRKRKTTLIRIDDIVLRSAPQEPPAESS